VSQKATSDIIAEFVLSVRDSLRVKLISFLETEVKRRARELKETAFGADYDKASTNLLDLELQQLVVGLRAQAPAEHKTDTDDSQIETQETRKATLVAVQSWLARAREQVRMDVRASL